MLGGRMKNWKILVILTVGTVAFLIWLFWYSQPSSEIIKWETYRVKGGDTLWKIAEGVTPIDRDIRDIIIVIMEKNNMKTVYIIAGEEIKIPTYSKGR